MSEKNEKHFSDHKYVSPLSAREIKISAIIAGVPSGHYSIFEMGALWAEMKVLAKIEGKL